MTEPDWHWHDNELVSYCYCGTAPDLSPDEAEIVARFDAAPAAPESYVQQHRTTSECWCGPEPVGFSGAWLHRKVEES